MSMRVTNGSLTALLQSEQLRMSMRVTNGGAGVGGGGGGGGGRSADAGRDRAESFQVP